MARFAVNQPITTRESAVTVDAGLAAGRHRFRLEVIDTGGRRSRPSEAVVAVERRISGPLEPRPPIVEPGAPVRPLEPIVTPTPLQPVRRNEDPT